MIEVTKYIADDGTEFENADECRRHELEVKMNKIKGLKLWREEGKNYVRVNCDKVGLETATLCIIEDVTALECINTAGDEYGYIVPDDVGMWYWSEKFGGEWFKYKDFAQIFDAFKFMTSQMDTIRF